MLNEPKPYATPRTDPPRQNRYASKRIEGREWSETHRWSAWVYTDPQGIYEGDGNEVARFLTREQAEKRVRESKRGGEIKETVVQFGHTTFIRWEDIIPGGCYHHLWDTI